MMEKEAEHQINSVNEYLAFLKQFDQYLQSGELFFRGQGASHPTVIPSIAHQAYSKEKEAQYLIRCGIKNETQLFSRIAYGQHYAIPTRFLDFTTNPLVALFFAVNHSEREDSVVFVFIKPSEGQNTLHVKALTELALWPSTSFSDFAINFNNNLAEPVSEETIRSYITNPVFIDSHSIDTSGNERLSSQSGTFVVCSNNLDNDVIGGIKGVESTSDFLTIAIPFEYKSEIRQELIQLGYTPNKMFPDTRTDNFLPFKSSEKSISESMEIVDEGFDHKGYVSKYSARIALNGLFTADEIKEYAIKLADGKTEDRIFLWFARDVENASKSRNNLVSTIIITNKRIPLFSSEKPVSVDPGDAYVAISNYYDTPHFIRTAQRIPVKNNALIITLEVKMTLTRMVVKTNLPEGASLFFSSDQIRMPADPHLLVKDGKITFPISLHRGVIKGKFSLILTFPNTQSEQFLRESGIQYEKIDSSQFIRSGLLGPTAEWEYTFSKSGKDISVRLKAQE